MKTIKRSFRIWFAAVLFISAGALSLRAIWAEAIDPTSGNGVSKLDACWAALGQCNRNCDTKYRNYAGAIQARQQCYNNCVEAFYRCNPTNPAAKGSNRNPTGLPITKNPPPNAAGPNPTPAPTPRRDPIKGPPHRLGPSPSPTANPILLAKPTSPTPSPTPRPKKHSGHDHH